MNFAPFSVETTNIFPCANSTAGAQLLSEFNLRARESVATPADVKYMIGPSYVHSKDDFAVSLLTDDLNNTIASTVFVINEGKGVINGHFVQSLTPIHIDLAVANQWLGERNRPLLKGKLKVGLRVMYSTETTMAGAMLKENEKYYEGIHVVVLPENEFHLPTDKPGINQQQAVTAHLWLADISFVNGRLSSTIKQNEHKCEMMEASRISDISGVLGSEFLKQPNMDAGKLYVYGGKLDTDQKDSEGNPVYRPGWCQAQDSLMIWDTHPAYMDESAYTDYLASIPKGINNEARFQTTQNGQVALLIPHKQVDGGLSDTSGRTRFYAPKQIQLPVADFAMGTPGTVDTAYTNQIKDLQKKLNNFSRFVSGTQRAYIPILDDVADLPDINPKWAVGDYILVGQDNTTLYEGSTTRPPSTMYFVAPGPVMGYEYVSQIPSGVQLGYVEVPEGTESELSNANIYPTLFDLGSQDTGWNYSGTDNDYFKATVPAAIPSLHSGIYSPTDTPVVFGIWYTSIKTAKSGNAIMISRDGYADPGNDTETGCLHVYMPAKTTLRCELGAKLNLREKQVKGKYEVALKLRGEVTQAALESIKLVLGLDKNLDSAKEISLSAMKRTTYVASQSDRDVWYNFECDADVADAFNTIELRFGTNFDDGAELNVDIDNLTVCVSGTSADVLEGAGTFYNSLAATAYYKVSSTGERRYSEAIWLTGEIPLATESAIGGFVNVPDTYVDAGYVRLNENGHLVLNDYALLRTGVLAYQLGEDFNTSAGLSSSNIQKELDEYVNQRVAFPNAKHIQKAQRTNVIHVTLNLSAEEVENIISVYNIDSRFNTCVYLHIRGEANELTSVNISDCAKLRLDVADECKCFVNIARCNVYYDAAVLDRLNYISDMDLWYERFDDSDPWLQVTGRTVTQISGPLGWESQDFGKTTEDDLHYQYALKSLTFSSSGNIIGIDLAIKNELTDIDSSSNNEYLQVFNFRIPQASGFIYPETRLRSQIKVSGHFLSIPAKTDKASGLSIVETDFVAVNAKYDEQVRDNSLHGSISFYSKVHTVSVVSGIGNADQIAGWASGDYHVFHGEVAHESNT